jgi:hypothetical protein
MTFRAVATLRREFLGVTEGTEVMAEPVYPSLGCHKIQVAELVHVRVAQRAFEPKIVVPIMREPDALRAPRDFRGVALQAILRLYLGHALCGGMTRGAVLSTREGLAVLS